MPSSPSTSPTPTTVLQLRGPAASCSAALAGIGDSMVKINGSFVALNCDKFGYNRPTVAVLNGTGSRIDILEQGQQVPDNVTDAIAAGLVACQLSVSPDNSADQTLCPSTPRRVRATSTSRRTTRTPTSTFGCRFATLADEHTQEHAANTAVGLTFADNTTYMYLVTADGYDGTAAELPIRTHMHAQAARCSSRPAAFWPSSLRTLCWTICT